MNKLYMEKYYYVGCLIELDNETFAFQKRDKSAVISSPNMISTFGGRKKLNENELEAIQRELKEEIDILIPENDFRYLGYFERYDEIKNIVVGCSYYYLRYKKKIKKCSEGDLIIVQGFKVLQLISIGQITKEMYCRLEIYKSTKYGLQHFV